MLRGVKSLLSIGALVGVGFALRWMTAGSFSALNTNDLDSLTVLAVGAVAWVAYAWLVLAVLATALEQLPGAIGRAAGVLATSITSSTSRALLRSALGVAAVTPLAVGVANAASPHTWTAPETGTTQPAANWRATEPRSTVQFTGTDFRATEPRSSAQIGGEGQVHPHPHPHSRAAVPRSSAETNTPPRADSNFRATEPRSTVQPGAAQPARPPRGVPVPDRPETGASTRYTDLQSGRGVNVPQRVTVRPGDTLWDLAAKELGARATNEQIDARWHQWYAANRQVIGDDPNLILPGQVLRVPPTHQEQ